jgi:hypothetical protein
MTPIPAPAPIPQREHSIRVPVLWGLAFGAIQAASPLALWWLDQATVQALLLALIAAVYIGFAVADGRPKVIAVECTVAGAFVLLAAAGVTGPAWLLVLGYAGHGLKDFWQEHRDHCRSRISSLARRQASGRAAYISKPGSDPYARTSRYLRHTPGRLNTRRPQLQAIVLPGPACGAQITRIWAASVLIACQARLERQGRTGQRPCAPGERRGRSG